MLTIILLAAIAAFHFATKKTYRKHLGICIEDLYEGRKYSNKSAMILSILDSTYVILFILIIVSIYYYSIK